MHLTHDNWDRYLERELARADKADEHRMKGAVLGIDARSHARLAFLFLKAGMGPSAFRGLTGDALAARIREVWTARGANGNA